MNWIWRLFSNVRGFARKNKTLSVVKSEESPDILRDETVYLIGEGANLWAAIIVCPCGCGEAIHLNLLEDSSPCWSVLQSGKQITIEPSIARQKGCRSHFFIRRGKIEWFRPLWNS
jgi:hypothetical protein